MQPYYIQLRYVTKRRFSNQTKKNIQNCSNTSWWVERIQHIIMLFRNNILLESGKTGEGIIEIWRISIFTCLYQLSVKLG